MAEALMLALTDFQGEFVLETYVHPIFYYSRKFCPKILNASTYVRELCPFTSVVKKWCTYLLGRKFKIYTDQRSLRELMTHIIQTLGQQFYLAKLLGYSYEIVYEHGAQNRVADALSRIHEPAT